MRNVVAIGTAGLLALVGLTGQPSTRQPETESLVSVQADLSPIGDTCCAGECNCCTCEKEPKSEPAPEVAKLEAPRKVGEVRTVNGQSMVLAEVWREGDQWKYRYQLQSQPVTPSVTATGYYDGTSQWTYPGDIRSHLMSSNHNFTSSQLAGKSKDEMEAMHDAAHNATRVSVPQVQYQPMQSTSSCPGGVCPTQPVRRSVGRRWFR